MADNAQKLWFVQSVPQRIEDQISRALHDHGNALPCQVVAVAGQIVTVKFLVTGPYTLPQVTIPIATSVYDWLPVQAGDTGIAEGGTIYIGGVSGLGGGTADLTPRGNLSCLVYRPTSNKSWSAPNANQRVVQGPAGALIRTTDGTTSINVTETGVTITVGSKSWTFTSAGLTSSSGVVFESHVHDQAPDSHGDTEQPTGGPLSP